MANTYDGSIRLNTEVDTRNVNSQMLRLRNDIKKTALQMEELTSKMHEIGNQKFLTEGAANELKELEAQLKKAQAEYDKLQSKATMQGPETSAYSQLKKDLAAAASELEKLVEEQTEWENMGLPQSGGAWDTLNEKVADASDRVDTLKEKMQALEDSGQAYQPKVDASEVGAAGNKVDELKSKIQQLKDTPSSYISGNQTEEYAKMAAQVDNLNSKLDVSNLRLREMYQRQRPISNTFTDMRSAASKITSIIGKMFSALTSGGNKTESTFSKMRRRIVELAKSAFIFTVIGNVFRDMVSGIEESFKSFAKYSSEYNNVVSSLKSANTQLKNSIASAFAPIVQTAIPYITALIQHIIKALQYVAQFIAILTGRSTWIKAKAAQEDYAGSLEDTASAAKKAYGALAKFDDLDVLNNDTSSSGGAGGTAAGDLFEEVPIDKSLEFDWDTIKEKAEELGRKIADYLNGIWEDEELAQEIGENLAELLNTGVSFTYGFVDETEWQEMGQWLGTLVQTGLDTFDEAKLGQTVGKLVNGIADSIIGYFQRYDSGALGSEIASFLNNALAEVNSERVGTSIGLVCGGILEEISTFFSNADWKVLSGKISDMLVSALTAVDEDGSVGTKTGETIASIINAGIDLILGADINGMAEAFGSFLTDAIISAVQNIDWTNVLETILKGFTSLPDMAISTGKGIGTSILRALGVDEESIQAASDKIPTLGEAFDSLTGKIKAFIAEKAVMDGNIFDVSALQKLQEEFALTDSQIDSLIQSMMDANTQLDLSTIGLSGYKGSWEQFKGTLSESTDAVNTFKETNEKMTQSVGQDYIKISTSAKDSSAKVKTSLNEVGTETDALSGKITNLSYNTSEKMDSVCVKTAGVGDAFTQLNADASTSLDGTSAKMTEWFDGTVYPYFSKEQWDILMQNVIQSMTEWLDWMNKTLLPGWKNIWNSADKLFEDFTKSLDKKEQTIEKRLSKLMEFTRNLVMGPWADSWNAATDKFENFQSEVSRIADEVKNTLSSLFSWIAAQVSSALSAINSVKAAASSLPSISGASVAGASRAAVSSYSVDVPALASGSVIRGGNPFLAVLGDQPSSQTNVEAPLSTIEQALENVMNRRGDTSGGISPTISLNVNGQEFARLALGDILREMRIQGYDVEVLGVT